MMSFLLNISIQFQTNSFQTLLIFITSKNRASLGPTQHILGQNANVKCIIT